MIKTYWTVSVFVLTVILMIEEKSLNNLKEVNKSNKNKTTNDKSLPHNYQTHAVTNINQIHIFNFWRKKNPN